MSTERAEFLHRQRALADFGELALRSDDLQVILDEGCRLVADAMGTELTKLLEIEPGGRTAVVRAGFGWNPGIVGTLRVPLGERSSERLVLAEGQPVITTDVETEERFDFLPFLREQGVRAIVNAAIYLPGGEPFGFFQVDSCSPRTFAPEDVEFLRVYCMILGPVIDRLAAKRELRRSDERFRLVVEHALDHAIILSDENDIITGWFPGSASIFGWTEDEVIGRPISIIFSPEDQASGTPRWEMERAKRDGTAPNVRWHQTKDGRRVFLDGQTVALRNDDGSIRGFLKISQDTTQRKRAEERRVVLQEELQHRVRNVLAMISAVVNRADIRGTAEELRKSLSGRIAAMARTQALLTRGESVGVDLAAIIRDELLVQSAGDHVVTVEGPKVVLAPKAAEVLTLAIHELTTNAVKYGALGQPNGRIRVSWAFRPDGDQTWVDLGWKETGMTIAPEPERRRGFGSELIVRRVPYELRGSGDLTVEPDGLSCRISFPLTPGESVLQTDIPASARENA